MNLDPRIIAAFFAGGSLLLALLVHFAFRRRMTPCVRLWVAGLFVHAAGLGLASLRGLAPDALTVALAFSLVSLHYAFTLDALGRFYGLERRSEFSYWPYWPVMIVVGYLIGFHGNPAALRLAVGSGLALQLTLIALLLLTRRDRWPGVRTLMGGVSLISAAATLIHVGAMAQNTSSLGIFDPAADSGIVLLISLVLRMGFAFGFLLLIEAHRYEEVHHLASHDPLTGAYNRRCLQDFGERELARSQREAQPITALMFDLDHFKRINDTHGHLVGDQVLRQVGAIAQEVLRSQDILARYGGEEFCILAPCTVATGGAVLAERLRYAIAKEPLLLDDGRRVCVTISVGFASLAAGERCGHMDELLARADAALYVAKGAGRNRVAAAGERLAPVIPINIAVRAAG